MQTAVDYVGKTSLKDMIELPNRYSHTFYKFSYERAIAAANNPEGPEAKEMEGRAMMDAMSGGGM